MLSDNEITLRVLIEIRDSVRATNERVDETNRQLGDTNRRLEAGFAEVRKEFAAVRTEFRDELRDYGIRQATWQLEQTAATRNLCQLLQDRFELRDRVERCEADIATLKAQVDKKSRD
jgi:chromosome segregation ATPase